MTGKRNRGIRMLQALALLIYIGALGACTAQKETAEYTDIGALIASLPDEEASATVFAMIEGTWYSEDGLGKPVRFFTEDGKRYRQVVKDDPLTSEISMIVPGYTEQDETVLLQYDNDASLSQEEISLLEREDGVISMSGLGHTEMWRYTRTENASAPSGDDTGLAALLAKNALNGIDPYSDTLYADPRDPGGWYLARTNEDKTYDLFYLDADEAAVRYLLTFEKAPDLLRIYDGVIYAADNGFDYETREKKNPVVTRIDPDGGRTDTVEIDEWRIESIHFANGRLYVNTGSGKEGPADYLVDVKDTRERDTSLWAVNFESGEALRVIRLTDEYTWSGIAGNLDSGLVITLSGDLGLSRALYYEYSSYTLSEPLERTGGESLFGIVFLEGNEIYFYDYALGFSAHDVKTGEERLVRGPMEYSESISYPRGGGSRVFVGSDNDYLELDLLTGGTRVPPGMRMYNRYLETETDIQIVPLAESEEYYLLSVSTSNDWVLVTKEAYWAGRPAYVPFS